MSLFIKEVLFVNAFMGDTFQIALNITSTLALQQFKITVY